MKEFKVIAIIPTDFSKEDVEIVGRLINEIESGTDIIKAPNRILDSVRFIQLSNINSKENETNNKELHWMERYPSGFFSEAE